MAPTSGSGNASEKTFPNAVEADQEMIESGQQEATVLGHPPFSSPNPATEGRRMLPLQDGTSAHVASVDAAAKRAVESDAGNQESAPESDADMKAADWKAEVEAATTQDELDAIGARYSAAGADYVTVEDAIQKKQDEFDAADDDDNPDAGQ